MVSSRLRLRAARPAPSRSARARRQRPSLPPSTVTSAVKEKPEEKHLPSCGVVFRCYPFRASRRRGESQRPRVRRRRHEAGGGPGGKCLNGRIVHHHSGVEGRRATEQLPARKRLAPVRRQCGPDVRVPAAAAARLHPEEGWRGRARLPPLAAVLRGARPPPRQGRLPGGGRRRGPRGRRRGGPRRLPAAAVPPPGHAQEVHGDRPGRDARAQQLQADQQRGLHRPGGDRRRRPPGVRAEAAARRRLPPPHGRAVRVRPVHGQPGEVRRPCRRPARPVGRVQGAAVPRELRLLPRQLRQGPEQARQGAAADRHRRQLAGVVHLPSGQRGAGGVVVRRHVRLGAARPHPVLREAEQDGQRVHGAVQLEPPVQRAGGGGGQRAPGRAAEPHGGGGPRGHVAPAPPRPLYIPVGREEENGGGCFGFFLHALDVRKVTPPQVPPRTHAQTPPS